ncbi:hypothetical protein CDD81_4316 [Ophiocordyceps australis]|uniref:SHSP domain-containing protein n=1 Tax=Ophiocordyceps australis TaxID=1399860 RepID=A0A2C5Y756_9HYPO|nr:hypothetical protein CDD81_4316 [Ophiocordyceps australis]
MAQVQVGPGLAQRASHAPDVYAWRGRWDGQATRRERRQQSREERAGEKQAKRQRRRQRHGEEEMSHHCHNDYRHRHNDSHNHHNDSHNHHHHHNTPPSSSSSSSTALSSPPPIDVFDTPVAYVVHLALPGTPRDDVVLAWHPDTSRLRISGCIRRPGDDLFLDTLVVPGRPVGAFDHSVALPPAGASLPLGVAAESDISAEVDADYITAKMEDGVLVVVVPKLARDWTAVRRVDIE